MGRHRQPGLPPGSDEDETLSWRGVLGWALFVVPLTVVVLLWSGAGWDVALGVGALGAAAFAVLWLASTMSS